MPLSLRTLTRCFFLISAFVFTTRSLAVPSYISFPSDVDWVTRDSKHFSALYRRGSDQLALRALRAAEKSYDLLRPIFPDAPERTYLVLTDFRDSTNGYGLDFPWPHMVIFAAPPDATDALGGLDDWLSSVILHEYTHILHLYPVRSFWRIGRAILGSYVVPVGLMPTHFHEGLATFMETHFTRGGRGRGSVFAAWRRGAEMEGQWNLNAVKLDRLDGTPSLWPHGASAYFYGYELYEELWRRKGADGIKAFTEAAAGNWPYFLEHTDAHDAREKTPTVKAYDAEPEELWNATFAQGSAEAKAELAKIAEDKIPAPQFLTEDRYRKADLVTSPDTKEVVFRTSDPSHGAWLTGGPLPTGPFERKIQIGTTQKRGMCWGRDGDEERILFIDLDTTAGYERSVLIAWDNKRDKTYTVEGDGFELQHIHALACRPDLSRVLVYAESGGEGAVLELDWSQGAEPLRRLKVSRRWPLAAGSWGSALWLGNDAVAAVRNGTTTVVYRWLAAEEKPRKVFTTQAIVSQILGYEKEGSLLAVAEIAGRPEVWRLDGQKNRAYRRAGVATSIDSAVAANDGFVGLVYRHGGYDLAKLDPPPSGEMPFVDDGKKAATWLEGDTKVTAQKEYSPWRTAWPQFWIPTALVVPDGLQAGAYVTGFDLSQRHNYSVVGGYDTRGSPFSSIDYTYRYKLRNYVSTTAYYAPNYLIAAREFQRRYGGTVAFGGLISLGNLVPEVGVVYEQSQANSLFPIPNRAVGASAGFRWKRGGRMPPAGITSRDSTTVTLVHNQYLRAMGSETDYYSTSIRLEQTAPLPFDRHALYMNVRAGVTEKARAFYMSYFQGGGELAFDTGRGTFLNRGYLPGTFLGTQMVTGNLEWRFPLLDVERGHRYFPMFLRRFHGALIADAMTVNRALPNYRKVQLGSHFYGSVGAELKSDWTISYYLPATLRLGFYRGLDAYGQPLYFTMALEASL